MPRLYTLIFVASIFHLSPALQADDVALRTRHVRFTYSAEVRDVPTGAKEATLWIPFPPSNDSQEISNIVVRSDVPTADERDGRRCVLAGSGGSASRRFRQRRDRR